MTMAPAASHMTRRLLAVLIAGLLVSSIAAAIWYLVVLFQVRGALSYYLERS